MSFVWMFGAVYLNPFLFKYFKSIYVLEGCLVGFTLLSPLLVFPSSMLVVILIFSFCILFGAMAWPIFNGIISDASSDENQGKILGLSQSVQSFSMAISPIIGGFAFAIFEGLPFYVASLCAFLSLLIYFFLRKKKS
jgi:DHA1 family tetracycline resistance protein-like MFS transporter